MALIKCPECGKEISDKAEKCIHCGYPLKNKTIINKKEYDFSYELELVLKNKNIEAIKSIREKTGLGLADGKDIIDYMVKYKECPTIWYLSEEEQSKVHCPYCNSTNVKKISGTERVTSVAMMGIFSKKINKSFKCNACGGTF